MKNILGAFAFMLISTVSMSQSVSPTGIYYLDDVMETASGFKLNPDSTFEFFLSQGALDRTGSGTWSVVGDTVILKSSGKEGNGFILQKSEKIKNKKLVVVVKESNAMLLSFIYARPVSKTATEFMKLGADGSTEMELTENPEIELKFEICAERTYSFKPLHSGDNYLELTIDPKIMDVYFENFQLKIIGNVLKGKNPILRGDSFNYVKSK